MLSWKLHYFSTFLVFNLLIQNLIPLFSLFLSGVLFTTAAHQLKDIWIRFRITSGGIGEAANTALRADKPISWYIRQRATLYGNLSHVFIPDDENLYSSELVFSLRLHCRWITGVGKNCGKKWFQPKNALFSCDSAMHCRAMLVVYYIDYIRSHKQSTSKS